MHFQEVGGELGIIPRSAEDFGIDSVITDDIVGIPFSQKIKAALSFLLKSEWRECQERCKDLLDITWEHLNTGHWKDVHIQWRYAYSYLSIFKAISEAVLERGREITERSKDDKSDAILTCDMGLLMGAPVLDSLLSKLVTRLPAFITRSSPAADDSQNLSDSPTLERDPKKLKLFNKPEIDQKNLISVLNCPSIEYFQREHFEKNKPVVMTDVIDYWPALGSRKWSLQYLKKVAGQRTVPIEIGSRYTDENWTQKLLTLNEFIDKHIESTDVTNDCVSSEGNSSGMKKTDPLQVGYLAQHQLFDQIPELQRDISIPTYCCIGENDDVDINAWFGPEGTISPLHQDPKHNILAQVVGYKYIRLYEEKYSENVYPHEGLLSNTSQVDVERPAYESFPLFRDTPCMECLLEPGQVLYIPPQCWHYVRSLSLSFSVSFWWE